MLQRVETLRACRIAPLTIHLALLGGSRNQGLFFVEAFFSNLKKNVEDSNFFEDIPQDVFC